jgi:hypothetical protein
MYTLLHAPEPQYTHGEEMSHLIMGVRFQGREAMHACTKRINEKKAQSHRYRSHFITPI